ncbi:hypothetical protein OIU83_13295 [Flavobacterium sp. LS1R49]|uniref:Uncharacterized protein n=1 Tax=Flavobacterium shii TaxID=2987687 RepID=A0A9X2YVK0_9FLAO|nr:manganese efflux pump [Flavobacterium shii]MCV9928638.1 hypothetical protein [Flavobacterium shii]
MMLAIHIAVILITLGITADNLVLSKMSLNTILFMKSRKAILLLIVLFTIQLQVLKYGDWCARLLTSGTKNQDKWIALIMLFSVAIKMLQEFKLKIIRNNKIHLELDDFLNISFATSMYVFVLGFAFRLLDIDEPIIYKTVIPCLLFPLLMGWFIKRFNTDKAIWLTKALAILMIFTGVSIFLINTI